MSRTRRKNPEFRWCRRPKTLNEISKNKQLLADIRIGEIPHISKVNRFRRFIPDAWEDLTVSALYEQKPFDFS
jgi:hypothetical protein